MPERGPSDPDIREGLEGLARFLAGETTERVFRYPTCHPARGSGFCHCDQSVLKTLRVYLRGALLELVLNLPWNGLKLRLLRSMGAKVGHSVYIAVGAWIDPVFPQLLTIEDEVLIGMRARIFTHEFRRDEFRAGKVILRRGAIVGAHALVGCGVEVGRDATVAPGAAVARDVPADCTALGNPARIVPRRGASRGNEATPTEEAQDVQKKADGGTAGAK